MLTRATCFRQLTVSLISQEPRSARHSSSARWASYRPPGSADQLASRNRGTGRPDSRERGATAPARKRSVTAVPTNGTQPSARQNGVDPTEDQGARVSPASPEATPSPTTVDCGRNENEAARENCEAQQYRTAVVFEINAVDDEQ